MRIQLWSIATGLCLFAHPAGAQTAPPLQPPPPPTIETLAPTAATALVPIQTRTPPMLQALDVGELSDLNGRQGSTSTILSDQDLTAINRGNSITANTVNTGPITLGPGAFEGFAGVGNFVINSGNNNNLQGALTINIMGR
ncbi:MAG: hypothetical protein EON90_00245 [Brevundimonas sp.]|nr:MAG: hypothetical protein EON90_00245 [Brevundimonas sp.]